MPNLDSLCHILLTESDPQVLTESVLTETARLLEAPRALIALLDPEKKALSVHAATGFSPTELAGLRLRPGEGVLGWVAQHGRPLLLPGSHSELGFAVPAPFGDSTGLCVPFQSKNVCLGAVYFGRSAPTVSFADSDVHLISILCAHLAALLQRQEIREQLDAQGRFLGLILENIPSSVVVIDRAMRIVSANQNFLEKGRRNARSTIGRKVEEVFPPVILEYMHLVRKVREVFTTGQSIEGGKVAYRAPGLPTRVYYYRLVSLRTGHSVENVMLLMDDITDRERLGEEIRLAERHLASVVECANDLVVSLSPDGRVVTWNHAAERVSTLRAEQVKGRELVSLCEEQHQSMMAAMLLSLAGGETAQHIEANLVTANQSLVPIAWSCSPMRDDSGRVMAIVAVGRDLTEQRRLEAQLIQSAKMASLGIMAGGIAHELRNPLGIISASAQLLLEQPDNAELRPECAERIHRATNRASLIIENLLKFARPKGDSSKETDLFGVLEDTISLLEHQLLMNKVRLEKNFPAEPIQVYANRELLQQVFTNLIPNASNAMPDGGLLTIGIRTVEGGDAELQFRDTGRGIPLDQRSKIFDPFFTTMPPGKGTGLGLSISYSIIQHHHGTIDVQSQVGKGSVFTVRLPLSRPTASWRLPVPE